MATILYKYFLPKLKNTRSSDFTIHQVRVGFCLVSGVGETEELVISDSCQEELYTLVL